MVCGDTSYQIKKQSSDKKYLSTLLFAFLILIVGAAEAQQKSTTFVSEVAKPEFKRLKMQLIGEFSTNLYDDVSTSKSSSMNLWILPTLNFRNETKLALITIFSRDISEEHLTKFSTTRLEYSLKPIETKAAKITIAPSVVLPTDYKLYEDDTLRGALALTLPTKLKIPLDKLSLSYSPRMTKNFHEYNTNNVYRPNVEYSIRHRVTAEYELSSKFSISLLNDFVQAWTYRGTPKQSFAMGQDLNYTVNKNLTVSIGHSNEGSAKRMGGAGSNIDVYNEHSSEIGLALDYVF